MQCHNQNLQNAASHSSESDDAAFVLKTNGIKTFDALFVCAATTTLATPTDDVDTI